MNQQMPIESQFISTLVDQLNEEIVLGTIQNAHWMCVAPMKALVGEVVGNLSAWLQHFGISVRELSGYQNLPKQHIQETQIIVTTVNCNTNPPL